VSELIRSVGASAEWRVVSACLHAKDSRRRLVSLPVRAHPRLYPSRRSPARPAAASVALPPPGRRRDRRGRPLDTHFLASAVVRYRHFHERLRFRQQVGCMAADFFLAEPSVIPATENALAAAVAANAPRYLRNAASTAFADLAHFLVRSRRNIDGIAPNKPCDSLHRAAWGSQQSSARPYRGRSLIGLASVTAPAPCAAMPPASSSAFDPDGFRLLGIVPARSPWPSTTCSCRPSRRGRSIDDFVGHVRSSKTSPLPLLPRRPDCRSRIVTEPWRRASS